MGGMAALYSFFLFAISDMVALARCAPPPLVRGTIFAQVMTMAAEATYGRGNVGQMAAADRIGRQQ